MPDVELTQLILDPLVNYDDLITALQAEQTTQNTDIATLQAATTALAIKNALETLTGNDLLSADYIKDWAGNNSIQEITDLGDIPVTPAASDPFFLLYGETTQLFAKFKRTDATYYYLEIDPPVITDEGLGKEVSGDYTDLNLDSDPYNFAWTPTANNQTFTLDATHANTKAKHISNKSTTFQGIVTEIGVTLTPTMSVKIWKNSDDTLGWTYA